MATEPCGSLIPDLFGAGNYAAVAASASSSWQRLASLGLIGNGREALESLGRFATEEARFHAAVTLWIQGDDEAAVRGLEGLSQPHARNLAALVRKPRIQVLAQLSSFTRGSGALPVTELRDAKFAIVDANACLAGGDAGRLDDVHSLYDRRRPPDFYVCGMIEQHLVPPNVTDLECPILGATADFDLNIQTLHPWLQLFDELVVTDPTEWSAVRRLVRCPVSTFPKLFGVSPGLPPLPSLGASRPVDVLLTGTWMHPYLPEKAELAHAILDLPAVTPLVLDGFLPVREYLRLLSQSRVCPVRLRHAGAMPTRGLEALSMGCVVVVPERSVLRLFVGEMEGALACGAEGRDTASVIQDVLGRWPLHEERARQGARVLRREFGAQRVASQYLRFLTFLAARPRDRRRARPPLAARHARGTLWRGSPIRSRSVLREVRRRSVAHWRAHPGSTGSPRHALDAARELVLEAAALPAPALGTARGRDLVTEAIRIYRDGLECFPRSLVLRFNLVRACLHVGPREEIGKALDLAGATVREPAGAWHVDPLENVFPWDFADTFFNYRAYFDRVTGTLSGDRPERGHLAALILASLHHYLALTRRSLAHARQAVTLDPAFAYYRLSLAGLLLNGTRTEDHEEGIRLLTSLVRSCVPSEEVLGLLRRARNNGPLPDASRADVLRHLRRTERSCLLLEEDRGCNRVLRGEPGASPSGSPASRAVSPDPPGCRPLPKVSFIVLDSVHADGTSALSSLLGQDADRSAYEVFWVSSGAPPDSDERQAADRVVTPGEWAGCLREHRCNTALVQACAPIVTVCESGATFRPDFVRSLIGLFGVDGSPRPARIVLHDRPDPRVARTVDPAPSRAEAGRREVAWPGPEGGRWFSCRRIDALRYGGVDEHRCFADTARAAEDLALRLRLAGIPRATCAAGRPDPRTSIESGRDPEGPVSGWDPWPEVARPYMRRLRWEAAGTLLPYRENETVRDLRRSLRRLRTHWHPAPACPLALDTVPLAEKCAIYLESLIGAYGASPRKRVSRFLKACVRTARGLEFTRS